jgi:stage II sporulation protein D
MPKWMNKPESLLAAAALGLLATVALLLNLSLASCESLGGGTRSGWQPLGETGGGPGGLMDRSIAPHNAPIVAIPPEHYGDRGPDMRIRIRTAVDKVSFGGSAPVMFWPAVMGGEQSPLRSDGTVEVTLVNGQFVLRSPEGVAAADAATGVWAAPVGASGPGGIALIGIDGVDHPGRIRVVARSDISPRAFDVIEHVALEEYLPGVVGKEMLTGWPLTAFQVQAVCARTYALQERSLSARRNEHFDLENSDRDQVYAGANRNPTILEAVRSTRGQVLMDGDTILRAYYSSTCGGRTASARDTWPTGKGYEYNLAGPIQAHTRESICDKSPLYRWTVERDRDELARRIRAFGERQNLLVRKLKTLHSIEPMAFNADGRPSRYKVIEPGGTWYQLSGEELRLACNNSVAAAPGVGVGALPVPGLPLVDRKTRVHSSDFSVRTARDQMIFSGRGFGHGVGMCQYCAKGFADRGDNWREIVQRFYPGATLKQLY